MVLARSRLTLALLALAGSALAEPSPTLWIASRPLVCAADPAPRSARRIFAPRQGGPHQQACRELAQSLGLLEKDASSALKLAERAVVVLAGAPEARHVVARAWLRLGDSARAFDDFLAAGSASWPSDPATLSDLAVAATNQAKDAVARRAYQTALGWSWEETFTVRLWVEYAALLSRGNAEDRVDARQFLQRAHERAADPELQAWAAAVLLLVDALEGAPAGQLSASRLGKRALRQPAWAKNHSGPGPVLTLEPRLAPEERSSALALAVEPLDRDVALSLWQAVPTKQGSPLHQLAESRIRDLSGER